MGLPTIEILACSDGAPCQMAQYGRGCYGRCAIDQLVRNGPQLAAAVSLARAGSRTHQEILQRAGIDY